MLFTINYVSDHDRQTLDMVLFYGSEDDANNFTEGFDSSDVISVESQPEMHEKYLERGLPLGADVFGNHPYSDGVNHIQA